MASVARGVLCASLFVLGCARGGLEYREAKRSKRSFADGHPPGAWKGGIDEDGAGNRVLTARGVCVD
jgi:hypothetical protein